MSDNKFKSFYGNITNTNRTQFQFDKIYPNRATMDANCAKDNIFIGRYVLVSYEIEPTEVDGVNTSDWSNKLTIAQKNYKIDNEVYSNGGIEKLSNEAYLNYNIEKSDDEIYFSGGTEETHGEWENSHGFRGYDATVWQKVFNDGIENYAKVADLNTITPTFEFKPQSPGLATRNVLIKEGAEPYVRGQTFRSPDSTNVDYFMLTPTDYIYGDDIGIDFGYIVPSSATIQNASNGEQYVDASEVLKDEKVLGSSEYRVLDTGNIINKFVPSFCVTNEDTVYYGSKLVPSKDDDGNLIVDADNNPIMVEEWDGNCASTITNVPDTIIYRASLPSLAKVISDIWDIIYPKDTQKTDKIYKVVYDDITGAVKTMGEDAYWVSTVGVSSEPIKRNTAIGYGHSAITSEGVDPEVLHTVAGGINTYLDLIGQIHSVRFSSANSSQSQDFAAQPEQFFTDVTEEERQALAKKRENNPQYKNSCLYYNESDNKYYVITSVLEDGISVEKPIPLNSGLEGVENSPLPSVSNIIASMYSFLYGTDGSRSLGDLLRILGNYIDSMPDMQYVPATKTMNFMDRKSNWGTPEWSEAHIFNLN